MAKPLIFYCLSVEIWLQHDVFQENHANNGIPEKAVIDISGTNLAGVVAVNTILKLTGTGNIIEIRQNKDFNNNLEKDHRVIKRITKPMMGFKAFHSASTTIAGIEEISKNQFVNDN